jgi:hypothetical protein
VNLAAVVDTGCCCGCAGGSEGKITACSSPLLGAFPTAVEEGGSSWSTNLDTWVEALVVVSDVEGCERNHLAGRARG